MSQVNERSLWGLIDGALGLTSRQRSCGGRGRARGPRRARPGVEALEGRAVPAVLVLGADGNLWQEGPGWQQNGRTWVDGNVQSFAQGTNGYDYVLGTDGNLWMEYPGWQVFGRTWLDGNVQSFAHGNDGYDYVLGKDGNLWKEQPGWQYYGRTWVDGNVQSFARGNDGFDYVLSRDGNLWKELPGWQYYQYGRTWVDGNVQSFARGNDGYDYVLGKDGNLWQELPGWQYYGRTWVDGNVRSFARGSDGYDYVLGTDGNLWQEQPYWQYYGRTQVDGSVRNFASDYDVASYVLDPRPTASTAYSPANGTLFGPNGPSYLDVRQGSAADCWLLASLAETAARAPADITSMFTYDGTAYEDGSTVGVYSVRFYDGGGVARYFTVDTELPNGGSTYDRPVGGSGAVNGSSSPVLWVALAEKAYAVATGEGFVTTKQVGTNSYAALNYGDPQWALKAITGNGANDSNINPSDVVSAWNAGKLVVLCTSSPSSSYIVGSHCYALVNYDSSSGNFIIFNPWGTDANGWAPGNSGTKYGRFWANAPFVSQNFSTESFGYGAATGGIFHAPGGYNPSDFGPFNANVVTVSGYAIGGSANGHSATTTADSSTASRNETNGSGASRDATSTLALATLNRAEGGPGTYTPGTFTDALTLLAGDRVFTGDDSVGS
jgi:hypothetical protein